MACSELVRTFPLHGVILDPAVPFIRLVVVSNISPTHSIIHYIYMDHSGKHMCQPTSSNNIVVKDQLFQGIVSTVLVDAPLSIPTPSLYPLSLSLRYIIIDMFQV